MPRLEPDAADAATDHPRPLLRRAWWSLDGPWDFGTGPEPVFDRTITVPFAPESSASGIGLTGFVERVWYRRRITLPDRGPGDRVLLHLGAVDRVAAVFVEGVLAAVHEGGYTAFSVDLTAHAGGAGEVEVVVRADDDPHDLDAPRGKQDWQAEPHSIWYPRTTGIWRTVWLEVVPATFIADVAWRAALEPPALAATVTVEGPVPPGASVRATVTLGGRTVAATTILVTRPDVELALPLGDGGIDDRWSLTWWPRRPTLLDVELELVDADGTTVDRALGYTALRTVAVDGGRFLLNGRPYPLRLVLDQGYWPDTGATPADGGALRRDVELTLALGFNGARKHQKTEDPRYFAWADRLGLLVWVEMPSAYRASDRAAARLLREWPEVVRAYRSHPSVVAWVPVNESWGLAGLGHDARQQALVRALAAVPAALDGTRPVSANDGWETAGGDIVGVHDYTQDPAELARRYADAAAVAQRLAGTNDTGRRLLLDKPADAGDRAVVLSEFGGVALADGSGTWGYQRASSAEDLLERYARQWAAVHASSALAGACWTQLTDTWQEANGLLRADRTPKIPLEAAAEATRGRRPGLPTTFAVD